METNLNTNSEDSVKNLINRVSIQNERDFLLSKADLAKETLLAGGKKILKDFNIKDLTSKYPFYTTGSAALLGFLVGDQLLGHKVKTEKVSQGLSPNIPTPTQEESPSLSSTILPMFFSLAVELLHKSLAAAGDNKKDEVISELDVGGGNTGQVGRNSPQEPAIAPQPYKDPPGGEG